MAADRELDVVLFGATGYTGALTAEYLAGHAPAGLRWALAGRDRGKLEALRDRLATAPPGPGGEVAGRAAVPEVRVADAADRDGLAALAAGTRVLASTVGPFLRHGEPLVAACARAGTDYLDLTGEPEFVDRMYLAHHQAALDSGARLVHSCGFDSVPHDLGAQFTVEQLPEGVPLEVRGYVQARGAPSGGTFDSALTALSRFRPAAAAHAERTRAELAGAPAGGRRARAVPGRPGYEPAVRSWVLPLPTIDPQVVARSARALDRYGPDFAYRHYAAPGNPLVAAGLVAVVAGTAALAQTAPTRALLGRLRPPGSGPTAAQRARGWFRVRFIGRGGGRQVGTEVTGPEPGYTATAVILAESAMSLALDQLPPCAGQVTPAVALGPVLRRRLEAAGIGFRVLPG